MQANEQFTPLQHTYNETCKIIVPYYIVDAGCGSLRGYVRGSLARHKYICIQKKKSQLHYYTFFCILTISGFGIGSIHMYLYYHTCYQIWQEMKKILLTLTHFSADSVCTGKYPDDPSYSRWVTQRKKRFIFWARSAVIHSHQIVYMTVCL